MAEIRQKIVVDAKQDEVMASLTTINGLASWWTTTTSGTCEVGEELAFRFGEHVSRMRIEELGDDTVRWVCTESAPDWIGTQISFITKAEGDKTALFLKHEGWAEANDFFAHCSMKWAAFLISLKDYVERGAGAPFPHDLAV